ncbi:hypothetical protein MFIFM68171_01005 [Madurella fahalii]|uniref:Uncharacterized protein n=1 Tax=Madurella fahalii TaxID=1157608 RepID=A0ABQ0FZ53_9PEZI
MSQLDESLADHHLHHHGQSFAASGPRSMDSSFQDSPTIGRTQVLSLAGTQGYTANSPLPTPSSTASSSQSCSIDSWLGDPVGLSASDSADKDHRVLARAPRSVWRLRCGATTGSCQVQKDTRAEPVAIEQRRLSPDESRPNATGSVAVSSLATGSE